MIRPTYAAGPPAPIRLTCCRTVLHQYINSFSSSPPVPQFFIKSFSSDGAEHSERCISAFPHPYPTLRDLQKVRPATGATCNRRDLQKARLPLHAARHSAPHASGAAGRQAASHDAGMQLQPAPPAHPGRQLSYSHLTDAGDHQVQAQRWAGAQRHALPAARQAAAGNPPLSSFDIRDRCGPAAGWGEARCRRGGASSRIQALVCCTRGPCLQGTTPPGTAPCPPCCGPTPESTKTRRQRGRWALRPLTGTALTPSEPIRTSCCGPATQGRSSHLPGWLIQAVAGAGSARPKALAVPALLMSRLAPKPRHQALLPTSPVHTPAARPVFCPPAAAAQEPAHLPGHRLHLPPALPGAAVRRARRPGLPHRGRGAPAAARPALLLRLVL